MKKTRVEQVETLQKDEEEKKSISDIFRSGLLADKEGRLHQDMNPTLR